MDMENNNKHDRVAKMWHAQNIKANLSKLSKLSSKPVHLQSPHQSTELNQTDTNFGEITSILSPRSKKCTNANTLIYSCLNCEKYKQLYKNQLKEKENIEAKYREIMAKYQEAIDDKYLMNKKLNHLSRIAEQASQSVEPYQNNVILMEQHLEQIKQSIMHNTKQVKSPPSESQTKIQSEIEERKRTIDFEIHFLLRNHEREQENNQNKVSRLNFVINYLENKNKQFEAQIAELQHENKILNGIIHESSYVVQQRELFHMASQELYQYKMSYITQKTERHKAERFVQKLKNKIYMLTSLIGYGVVSNIETNELQELNQLKKNIQNLNKVQQKLTFDICGTKSLKNYKSCYSQVKQFADNEDLFSCLYHSNFLTMFDDQEIQNGLEENVATIIKPEFFLLVRAILDSKYSQFLVQGTKVNRFPEFAYSFVDYFKVKRNENRIQINSKRNNDERDLMKNNFLLRIFDRKVGFLPEIATFRQFLIKNTPQDEVFYYLMCRNLIYRGPQLDNYLGSSDPYNFAEYEKVMAQTQQLLETLDRNCKNIIFNHLNDKKIMKNKKLLIKANYVIRLLLQVYRKTKKEKVSKLRTVFDQTCRMIKSDRIQYSYFKEILRKNFPHLSNSSITEYYLQSMSVFEANNATTFFESFSASCLEYIFLEENLQLNQQIKRRKTGEFESVRCNYLMELIPDSVSQLGNESIYYQYVKFIKLKSLNLETRVKISQFLLKIVELRLHSMKTKEKEQEKLAEALDELNNRLIDLINQNFKKRQKYEESLDKASSLIGKEFRKKIYEFYSQFVKDIKQQISSSTNNPNPNT